MAIGRRWFVRTLVAVAVVLGLVRPASAQLAARSADEWIQTLENPTRVQSLKIKETVAALKIGPGKMVADIGAGSGLFSLPLALAVKPGGKVFAVDIDQALIDHIAEKAGEQGIVNITPVLGAFTDPNMPDNVDLALIVDVLHHIEDRATYLKNLAQYLNPGGRVAIVEFKPEQSPHKADPKMVVSEAQAAGWLTAAGLKKVEDVPLFDDKWFAIYQLP